MLVWKYQTNMLYPVCGASLKLYSGPNFVHNVLFNYKIVNFRKLNHFKYGPKVIRLILNFELVKCCLLYFSQVNNYNQSKQVLYFTRLEKINGGP